MIKQDSNIFQRLQTYKSQSQLKMAAVHVLVKTLEVNQIKDLKKEFEKIDTDCSGFIEIGELKTAMQKEQQNISTEEIDAIIKEMDFAENNKINYSEFIAATINVKTYLNDDKIRGIFNSFDIDNTGYITKSNLKLSFSKYGRKITDKEID